METFTQFLHNVAVVIVVSGTGIYFALQAKSRSYLPILGVVFGLCSIIAMMNGIPLANGRLADFRHVVMTLAGYTGGPVIALTAASI